MTPWPVTQPTGAAKLRSTGLQRRDHVVDPRSMAQVVLILHDWTDSIKRRDARSIQVPDDDRQARVLPSTGCESPSFHGRHSGCEHERGDRRRALASWPGGLATTLPCCAVPEPAAAARFRWVGTCGRVRWHRTRGRSRGLHARTRCVGVGGDDEWDQLVPSSPRSGGTHRDRRQPGRRAPSALSELALLVQRAYRARLLLRPLVRLEGATGLHERRQSEPQPAVCLRREQWPGRWRRRVGVALFGAAAPTAPRLRPNKKPWICRAFIGAPRFELGTSPTRTVRATRLRHAPTQAPVSHTAA